MPLLAACGKQDADCKCPPAVRRVTPAGAAEGSKVVLEGSNFAPNPAANDVRINGAAATVTAASTGELTVEVPAGIYNDSLPYGELTVTARGRQSGPAQVFSEQYPQITAIAPTRGPAGTVVTLTGTHFAASPERNRVMFWQSTTLVAPTFTSPTRLQVVVPADAKTGTVMLYNYVSRHIGRAGSKHVAQYAPVEFTVTP
ncbi:IPT/TIG domain-containing protein [Hymenobacter edaphi]|uniref:IPT/TIG domain-containing protein n=1 Tax=Hymenobacter edaphi TaxID=2211146 RepID=UPI001402BEA1|nr:IPT/TIG domain-containing protein [Hymenobacter edaphi]